MALNISLDPSLAALAQVILIDIVLAGDNAVVIGLAAAQVPAASRRHVVFWGLSAAVVIRIALALGVASVLDIIGLTFGGGLLLLWVAYRLYRDITAPKDADWTGEVPAAHDAAHDPAGDKAAFRQAVGRIIVADLSMSLDNVLAVAGAAMDHVYVLVIGLLLSIAMMGVAATLLAKVLHRYRSISYAGLLIVLYVAGRMIYYGGSEIWVAVH